MPADNSAFSPVFLLKRITAWIRRWALFALAALCSLELYFLIRIVIFLYIPPSSTAFERSEAWRLLVTAQSSPRAAHSSANQSANQNAKNSYTASLPTRLYLPWLQEWRPASFISTNLKRAVIVSEDDVFATHNGVQWEALERAWSRNEKAEEAAQAKNAGQNKSVKIVGGSTITQQLAKNLFLSKERTLLRKAQELIITLELESVLSKSEILELYLNNVEWGAGVFGAQGASLHYFGHSANQLTPSECARLAVMLPRPKFFEHRQTSPYLIERSQVIESRMYSAKLPP